MQRHILRLVRIGAGLGFVLLGVAGLFLPILQGVLFLLIGLALLARDWPLAQRLHTWLRARFPAIGRGTDNLRMHLAARWQRLTRRRTGPNSAKPE
jgi:uncharacterized protein